MRGMLGEPSTLVSNVVEPSAFFCQNKKCLYTGLFTVYRLYTGIHAKPKPKFKTGAISESTTALNVGQTNNETPGAATAIPSSMTDIKRVTATSAQDQQHVASLVVAATAGSASMVTTTQKREAGLAKVQADKKKVDARKKSLKRL